MLQATAISLTAQFLRTTAYTISVTGISRELYSASWYCLCSWGWEHPTASTASPSQKGHDENWITACLPRQHQQAGSARYRSVLHLLHWICSCITDLWCWTKQQPFRDLSSQMLPTFTFQTPHFQTHWAAKGEVKSGCLTGLWVPLVYMHRADRKRIKKRNL